jgi:hypothetical protein
MKWTYLMFGSFTAIVCVGLAFSCFSVPNVPSSIALVSDSEAAQITAGSPGCKFTGVYCDRETERSGCLHRYGYASISSGNQKADGDVDCTGSCGHLASSTPATTE